MTVLPFDIKLKRQGGKKQLINKYIFESYKRIRQKYQFLTREQKNSMIFEKDKKRNIPRNQYIGAGRSMDKTFRMITFLLASTSVRVCRRVRARGCVCVCVCPEMRAYEVVRKRRGGEDLCV